MANTSAGALGATFVPGIHGLGRDEPVGKS